MADVFLGILGLLMFASWGYMLIAQFNTVYKERHKFGKFTTWFAIVTFALFVIGSLTEYSDT